MSDFERDTDVAVQDGAAEAAPSQGQPAERPAVDVQGETPQGAGPWMSDLQSLGLAESQLAAVDAYLREKWQPRVTQLEQKVAQADPAMRLYEDLSNDPIDTYLALTEELYGSDVAEQVLDTLRTAAEDEETPAQEAPTTNQQHQLDPRVEAVVNHYEAERAREAYEAAKREVLEKPENADIDGTLLDPFIAAAEGDMELAVQGYREYYKRWQERHGVPEAGEASEEAPPTLGGSTSAQTTPPVQSNPQTLDEAIDDFLDTVRASKAPPVVGSV